MLINGKADGITKDDLIKTAEKAGIKKSEAKICIEQITDTISKWNDFADEAGVSQKKADKIKGFFNISL